ALRCRDLGVSRFPVTLPATVHRSGRHRGVLLESDVPPHLRIAMLPLDFPGARRLIEAIDGAIRLDDETRTTRALCDALCEMIHGSDVRLPRCVFESVDDHYARRELYRSERFGYSVIAMTWGPRQGTPIHDHAGRWCVEGVW